MWVIITSCSTVWGFFLYWQYLCFYNIVYLIIFAFKNDQIQVQDELGMNSLLTFPAKC